MKRFIFFFIIFYSLSAHSQGITDTIIMIEAVPVYYRAGVTSGGGGSKEIRADSVVLLNKLGLSISDLLSENTSIFVRNSGRGANATAAFRGTAASHTQVLWNGMYINSPMTGSVDLSLIPVFLIDNVSMRYGSASIVDNSGGLGGAIKLSNGVDWQNSLAVRLSQGLGSYGTFNEFADLTLGSTALQVRTRLFHNRSANDYTFKNMRRPQIAENGELTFPIDTNKNADYTLFGLLQEFYWRVNPSNVLSVKYWGQRANRAIPTVISYEGDVNSNLSRQTDADHRLVAEYRFNGQWGDCQVNTGFSQQKINYLAEHLIAGAGRFPTVDSRSRQRMYYGKIDYQRAFADNWRIRTNVQLNFFDVTSVDSVVGTGYSTKRLQTAMLLSVRKTFVDRLNLNLTLRQEMVDNELVPLIHYFGFDYQPLANVALWFKGNIARNYHQPSLNDLYWVPGGNPDLQPEEGVAVEFGAEYRLRAPLVELGAELTYYRADINQWIVWLPNFKGYWEPRNVKRVLSTGLEGTLKIDGMVQKFNYRLSGTVTYSKSINYGDVSVWGDNSYGKQMVYVPLFSGNVLVNVEYNGFYLNYQFNSFSERFTTSSNEIQSRQRLYPYFMNNLCFGKLLNFSRLHATVELRIYNLFNERYHSELLRPMPRRNYLLQISLKY